MKKIFLAGPIRNLEREVAVKWRKEAETLLSDNFIVLNPLRGREERGTFPQLKGIVARDKNDIQNSDILLVSCPNSEIAMIGTSMEIMFAYERGLVVVLVGDGYQGNLFLEYHSHMRFKDLEEAANFLNKMFA